MNLPDEEVRSLVRRAFKSGDIRRDLDASDFLRESQSFEMHVDWD
jgi:hypothetical protein